MARIRLSKNFYQDEFACHCREATCVVDKIHPELIAGLQELRDLHRRPISILSGGRCPTHNKRIGGSERSQHLPDAKGYVRAADIVLSGYNGKEAYTLALRVPEFKRGGIGLYPGQGFIHVDVRGTRARWARITQEVDSKIVKKYVAISVGLKAYT